jgi:hypothetical protein
MTMAIVIFALAIAFTEQVMFWNKIIGNDCNWKVSK